MKVIVINGPMGVGKTTVGRLIAEKHPGTAFIDGDWCMDLHPFVGSRETRDMAADSILHMIRNYQKCSACSMVVLVWLMDDPCVRRKITDGLSAIQAEMKYVTLVCSEDHLISRWKNDRNCEWRTDEWLKAAIKSLPQFLEMDNTISTDDLTAEQAADQIMKDAADIGSGSGGHTTVRTE